MKYMLIMRDTQEAYEASHRGRKTILGKISQLGAE